MFCLKCQRRRCWHWCLSSWNRRSRCSKGTEQKQGQKEERREERWLWVSVSVSLLSLKHSHYGYVHKAGQSGSFSLRVTDFLLSWLYEQQKTVNPTFSIPIWTTFICGAGIRYVAMWPLFEQADRNSCDFYISPPDSIHHVHYNLLITRRTFLFFMLIR